MKLSDKRYTIGLEYCGQAVQKHVLRFCGDFVSQSDSREMAEVEAVKHAEKRGNNQTGLELLSQYGDFILLLATPKRGKFRVAYGAEVNDFSDLQSALAEYSNCIRHLFDCEEA